MLVTSNIYWIPTELNDKNIFKKLFLCHHYIAKHKQPRRICSLLSQ